MASKTYDFTLSCGCMISLDAGGGLIPCDYEGSKDCKYFEEYLCSPHWVEWELECFTRNNYYLPDEEMSKIKKELQKEFEKRIKEKKVVEQMSENKTMQTKKNDYGFHYEIDAETQLKSEEKLFSYKEFLFNFLKVFYQNTFKFYVLQIKRVKQKQKQEFKKQFKGKKEVQINTKHGFKMFVDANDYGISKDLALFGEKEPLLTQKFKEGLITNENDVVLEVGANIGYFALLQKHAEKVFCVEPVKKNCELLEKNVKLNKCKNFKLFKMALGSVYGRQKIFLSNEASNWASMLGKGKNFEVVQILTIDSFSEINECPSIIRMDIEGFELEVLKGATETLKNPKLTKILIGIHYQYLGKKNFEELFGIIQENGFGVEFALDEKSIVDIESKTFRWIMQKLNQEHLLKHELSKPSFAKLTEWIELRHQCPNVLFVRK